MERPSLALATLIAFWVIYGIGAGWALYQGTPLLSRPLLLILGAYSVFLVLFTAAIFWGVWKRRSRAEDQR
jgi:hypothetical protein